MQTNAHLREAARNVSYLGFPEGILIPEFKTVCRTGDSKLAENPCLNATGNLLTHLQQYAHPRKRIQEKKTENPPELQWAVSHPFHHLDIYTQSVVRFSKQGLLLQRIIHISSQVPTDPAHSEHTALKQTQQQTRPD